MGKKSARKEYQKAKIELAKAVCDLLSDGIRIMAEIHCGLPLGSLGRSETHKKALEKKEEKANV